MTGAIGTRGEVADGVYTGELDGPFCYGPGKVEAMLELARWEGLDLGQCYAYSDSHSDLPMLSAVGHPVAVNPDGKLERHARGNGWPVVVFSERTKTVIRRTVAGAVSTGARRRARSSPVLELGSRRAAVRPRVFRPRGMSASCRDWATSAPVESHISPSSSNIPCCMKRLRNRHRSGPGAGTTAHVDGELQRRRPCHRDLGCG